MAASGGYLVFRSLPLLATVISFMPSVDGKSWAKVDFIDYFNGLSEAKFRVLPFYITDEPTKIGCDISVHSFDSINEANMEFTVDISIHFTWKNKAVLGETSAATADTWKFMDIDAQNMDKIWVPDIYFPNEKRAAIHKVMMTNKMLRVYSNHTFSYIIRMTQLQLKKLQITHFGRTSPTCNVLEVIMEEKIVSLTLGCQMDLQKYPFDKQVCSIYMESFSFTSDKLLLEWQGDIEDPVQTKGIIELRQFRMLRQNHTSYNRTHQITGTHSCLRADFHLVRNTGYYIIQMYVPSFLIVTLSWLSFWLNVSAIPGRVTLGVLSVLTISTQSSSVNAHLPRVSYTKAIDVWFATCLVFVFAALIEFAVVNVLSSKVPGRRFSLATLFTVDDKSDDKDEKDTVVGQDGRVSLDQNNQRALPRSKIVLWSTYLDVASRFMFPAAFGIFNTVYWIYYLNVTEY